MAAFTSMCSLIPKQCLTQVVWLLWKWCVLRRSTWAWFLSPALVPTCWVTLGKSPQVRSAPSVGCLKYISPSTAGEHFSGQQDCLRHPHHGQVSCSQSTHLVTFLHYAFCYVNVPRCNWLFSPFKTAHSKVRPVLQLTRAAFNCMKWVLDALEQGMGTGMLWEQHQRIFTVWGARPGVVSPLTPPVSAPSIYCPQN